MNIDYFNNEKICIHGENVPVITFRRYNELPYIKHAFTTKLGGVSKGIFESLNLSFSRNDDDECVKNNYEKLCADVPFTLKNIVMSDQVHKTDVLNITKDILDSLDKNDFTKRKLSNIDGMITNLRNVPLFTYYADCVPLYFVDTKNKAIGLSHSGWRGTAECMGMKTIHAMKEAFGTNPLDLICAIGPSICQKCYEVSEDVIDAISDSFNKQGIIIENPDKTYYKTHDDKYQLNLWEVNRLILKKAGVKPENIIISDICTCCNSKYLFSHRATNGKRGNLAAVLEII